MEAFEYDITKILLGEVQATNSVAYNDFAHLTTITEDVIEKPEVASSVGEIFKHWPKTELAEVIYG